MQRFATGGGGQPGADSLRLLDAAKVLQQAEPGRLRDISGVGGAQAMSPGDGPHRGREPVYQRVPRGLFSGCGRADEGDHCGSISRVMVAPVVAADRGHGPIEVCFARPGVIARTGSAGPGCCCRRGPDNGLNRHRLPPAPCGPPRTAPVSLCQFKSELQVRPDRSSLCVTNVTQRRGMGSITWPGLTVISFQESPPTPVMQRRLV